MFVTLSNVIGQEIDDSLQTFPDSTTLTNNQLFRTNNLKNNDIADTLKVDTTQTQFKPDPTKVLWMGAIIPGFGQIANRKYWKLPIVYAGFMGFAYAISFNSNRYNTFKNAYRDISDSDPNTNSYLSIVPKGYEYIPPGGTITDPSKLAIKDDVYKNYLNSNQEGYHRYRDMSILLSIGYYGIVLLEAYVDAHLYDFDISSNLTLNIVPARMQVAHNNRSAYGFQCSINF